MTLLEYLENNPLELAAWFNNPVTISLMLWIGQRKVERAQEMIMQPLITNKHIRLGLMTKGKYAELEQMETDLTRLLAETRPGKREDEDED